jgi:hypothetical protein
VSGDAETQRTFLLRRRVETPYPTGFSAAHTTICGQAPDERGNDLAAGGMAGVDRLLP